MVTPPFLQPDYRLAPRLCRVYCRVKFAAAPLSPSRRIPSRTASRAPPERKAAGTAAFLYLFPAAAAYALSISSTRAGVNGTGI